MINILMTSFVNQRLSSRTPDIHWLPHSVGCLISYARKSEFVKQHYKFFTPIYIPHDYEYYYDILAQTDILCMSNYVWNQKYNDGLAKYYKKINPSGIVVYGGANVPEHKDYAHTYALERPYVDIFFVGPGEINITKFLENINNDISVHNGAFAQDFNNVVADKSLYSLPGDQIPNPYLDGVFDEIINSIETKCIGITLETTRGCPFKCSFCDWGGLSRSVVNKISKDDVLKTIEWIYSHGEKIASVDIIDANLGMTARDLEIVKQFEFLYNQTGHYIHITTNGFVKNGSPYLLDTMLTLNRLSRYSKNIMLSFQTHSQPALEVIDRGNIRNERLYPLIDELKKQNLNIKSEMILGLPGETPDDYKNTLQKDFELGIESMRAYPLVFIVNTPMYETEYRLKHGIKTKKIRLPYDLHITRKNYVDKSIKTSCDFNDESEFEEIEVMYECNSYTNEDLITILKYWWWYHNFYNLGTIKSEITKMNITIGEQIDLFFTKIARGDMPVLSHILSVYESAVRNIFKPEPISNIIDVNAVWFFQKGMRTYEAAYFIDHADAVKSELEQIYGTIDTSHWHNRYAVVLDDIING